MKINVYSEELTNRTSVIKKGEYLGLRFHLELPIATPLEVGKVITRGAHVEDASAVTFWSDKDLRPLLTTALATLDEYYGDDDRVPVEVKPNVIGSIPTDALLDELRKRTSGYPISATVDGWSKFLSVLARKL